MRASTSILATIDDHEVINDFSGGVPADSDPRFNTTTGLINDTELYENGLQTFQEYNPLRDEFYGDTEDERTAGERKLYRYNTYGDDAYFKWLKIEKTLQMLKYIVILAQKVKAKYRR